MLKSFLEPLVIQVRKPFGIEGRRCFDAGVFDAFAAAPYDVCDGFEGPPGYPWPDARGKDHPRLGRFVYAFAKFYKPGVVVEVGTHTGGTAIGWARALSENGRGKLICVDSDAYSNHVYPRGIQINLKKLGIPEAVVELRLGDSRTLVPQLAHSLPEGVDLYLVDGDHRYEGALADMENGWPMMKKGGFILVHDIDPSRRMAERTPEHPAPVLEAFQKFARGHGADWCIVKLIRKHLGVIRVP